VTAPDPGDGAAASSGAAAAGIGTGTGGRGDGPGGGGQGSGGMPVTRAQLLSGAIGNRDNRGGRYAGRVVVELGITADGRVDGCRIVESSGDSITDAATCRLSTRIRFRPARLADGRAVPDHTFYVVTWRPR
jgi:protein TonB